MGALLDPRSSALSWCRRERIGGDGALAAGPRRLAILSRAQEVALIDAIRGGFPGELWTRRSVRALALSLLDVALPPLRVTRLLASWGAGVRAPADRACRMCAGAVADWLETTYPVIAGKAAAHRAEVAFVGRTRLCGISPAADVVTAVSGPEGRQRVAFMIAPGGPSATLPWDFLALVGSGRTTHAIVDGSWASWQLPRRLPPRVVLHPMPSCERR
ncbi:winged helix-turn-helix domain-containing protein [Asanoa sp. WMMD1127]|uniref:winged helix-turn-helix domain-containing protein n=1 Tax=Asanoa sp. WMMD1127 TaxID=3016107 RepID=UPI002417CDBF|nr:winged helix-turn-helix domain-containing protein [Asanoa sp. WMMD1127]MDG4823287.1 winged helix-turn-helix domain-containing protein [Asanoa sp. WMMD1127]